MPEPRQIDIEDAIAEAKAAARVTLTASPDAIRKRDDLAAKGKVLPLLSPEAMAQLEATIAERKRAREALRKANRPRPPTEGQLEKVALTAEALAVAALSSKTDGLVSRLWHEAPQALKRIKDAAARLEIQANPLWSAKKDKSSPGHPTDLRKAKEPYPLVKTNMAGGQAQHKPQLFENVYGRHMTDPQHEAVKLLRDAWEAVASVRVTSSRAYTGEPFAGGLPADTHMSQKQREYVELAEEWMGELGAITPVWGQRLAEFVLHVPDGKAQRVRHVAELGGRGGGLTDYQTTTKSGAWSDAATAAGVAAVNDALIRALEALQAVLVKRRYRKLAQQGTLGPAVDQRRVALGPRARR